MSQCYIAYQSDAGEDERHVVVKIGFSENPHNRFEQLQAMSWKPPQSFEATSGASQTTGNEIERYLHDYLARYRIHHEWFHLPKEALEDAKEHVCRKFNEVFVNLSKDAAA